MKVIIDIPEERYQRYEQTWFKRRGPKSCIAFGTPLPKGCERVFTEQEVYEKIRPHVNNRVLDDIMFSLTPIIIETERETKNG